MDFINIFFGCYCLVFAVALFIVAYALGYRSMIKGKCCTAKTTGVVERYSIARYNYVSLPVVKYSVEGKEYSVVGPTFKGGIRFTKSSPLNPVVNEQKSNLVSREELPDVIVLYRTQNSIANTTIAVSPLLELYPVGSTADVYYDPKEPKRAYVQRYVGNMPFLKFYMPLFFAIICVVLSVVFFFFI